jgi:hypothetical protein
MNEKPTCGNCRFQQRGDECHRFPPIGRLNVSDREGGWQVPEWPIVKDYDWCGEHQPLTSKDKIDRVEEEKALDDDS